MTVEWTTRRKDYDEYYPYMPDDIWPWADLGDYLYFAWRDRHLLYTGITCHPEKRFNTGPAPHCKTAKWWDDWDVITFIVVPVLYNELAAAELLAVHVGKPKYNRAKNGPIWWRRYDDRYWVSAGKNGLHCRVPKDFEWCIGAIEWAETPRQYTDEEIRKQIETEWRDESWDDPWG